MDISASHTWTGPLSLNKTCKDELDCRPTHAGLQASQATCCNKHVTVRTQLAILTHSVGPSGAPTASADARGACCRSHAVTSAGTLGLAKPQENNQPQTGLGVWSVAYLSDSERIQGVGGLREVLRSLPGCEHGPIVQHWRAHLSDIYMQVR